MTNTDSESTGLNIVFVIKAVGNQGGGAERVLVDVASGLASRGHSISIISSDNEGRESYYPLDKGVRRINLGVGKVTGASRLLDVVRRMIAIRRAVTGIKPDVVVAFMHSSYIPAGIALIGTGIPMVASEHIGPEHYHGRPLERTLLQLMPLIAKRITVVSRQILLSFGWWMRRRMTVIANPVSIPAKIQRLAIGADPLAKKTLLSVGRLAPQKNQRCLIAAFAEISKHVPNWKLRIVGEGELREALEAQARDLGLTSKIELPGAVTDISLEYSQADLFVLPSTYESFGLATAEALLHGLPAVGFADCPGTNSLIRDNENGILVSGSDRTADLAAALERLMANPQELKRLTNASTDWLESQFNIDSVLDSWESLAQDVAKSN